MYVDSASPLRKKTAVAGHRPAPPARAVGWAGVVWSWIVIVRPPVVGPGESGLHGRRTQRAAPRQEEASDLAADLGDASTQVAPLGLGGGLG
jgi:hypothetical protein